MERRLPGFNNPGRRLTKNNPRWVKPLPSGKGKMFCQTTNAHLRHKRSLNVRQQVDS